MAGRAHRRPAAGALAGAGWFAHLVRENRFWLTFRGFGRSLYDGSHFFKTNNTNGFVTANYNSTANCR
ncbi:hypothetical protein ACFCZ1_13115 [Streptomyces sp. NPDC056224]|uniref:hypothetical protein n=1 Tax=Streptomyces sp. NPDC056224 TaxID=3345750 RepID=UPI0035D76152